MLSCLRKKAVAPFTLFILLLLVFYAYYNLDWALWVSCSFFVTCSIRLHLCLGFPTIHLKGERAPLFMDAQVKSNIIYMTGNLESNMNPHTKIWEQPGLFFFLKKEVQELYLSSLFSSSLLRTLLFVSTAESCPWRSHDLTWSNTPNE